LVEYFLVQGVQRRLRNELEEKDKEVTHLEREFHKAQDELTLQEADLKKAAFELDEARHATTRAEEEKNRWMLQANAVNAELEKTRSANQTYEATVEDLHNQILGLKTRNAQLTEQIQTGGGAVPVDASPRGGFDAQAVDRLTSIEAKLEKITQENSTLLQELQSRPIGAVVPGVVAPIANSVMLETEKQLVPEVLVVEENPHLDMENSNLLMPDRNALRQVEKDDLTLIEGVGPFLEKKLNSINVFTFEQIAAWDAATVEQITRDIQFFEGRIEKDDWIGQAKRLMEYKKTGQNPPSEKLQSVAPAYVEDKEPLVSTDEMPAIMVLPQVEIPADSALEELPPVPVVVAEEKPAPLVGDDLTLIEGVGPKIADILKSAGIHFFSDLAKQEPDFIRTLLEAAGPIYKIQDPASWPSQARLAMHGEWEVLKDYQEQLRGGK
jgi:predicted flap endonuclease-1-like 5' DNA nuclease